METQYTHNLRFYERRSIGAHYARGAEIQPGEAEVLRRHQGEIRGGRILDLGVGGGRTTAFLLQLSKDYVGIDFSNEMIERCRARFPATQFEVRDAQDLSGFEDQSFDFILFSCTGIDSVNHDQRLRILKEVRRLLKPEGLFSFSSHNRNFKIPKPWNFQHFALSPVRQPRRFARRFASYPVGIFNYLRLRTDYQNDDYCIRTDSAHLYSIVHYWISPTAQKRQLEVLGFGRIELIGWDGKALDCEGADDSDDPWFHFVCRPDA